MNNTEAVQFLDSLLGRTLRIHTTDTRMFVGTFKCTDTVRIPFLVPRHDRFYDGLADPFLRELQDRNIILAGTCEYRFPPPSTIQAAADASSKDKTQITKADTIKVDMTSRLIGLVVVPGRYITRIEVEESPEEVRLREQRRGIAT
ncbi:LSM domain protein [Paecilomyces variotii No. 5]|uniref:LSM domain protein n=1 Tax=Byssochlamys spectabilis (strain No. 5 / NBRC 109023) TaxID=1356009 RepID=V5F918_BYSSN|nr:LSM domain protein [Paecilomyces variotii No. 5]